MIRIDLGCGRNPREGFRGLDKTPRVRPAIVGDLEGRLPLRTSSVDEFFCHSVMEHVRDLLACMGEVHRCLKPGGIITIEVPYYTSSAAWTDPTHVRAFTEGTFRYFCHDPGCSDYGIDYRFEEISTEFTWWPDADRVDDRAWAKRHYWNIVKDLIVKLRASK